MKKHLKQLLSMALVMAFIFSFAPQRAEASGTKYVYKISNWNQNTYAEGKEDGDDYDEDSGTWTETYHLKKITVPANGYISIKTTTKESLHFIKKLDRKKGFYDNTVFYCGGQKTYYRALTKGTWYVYIPGGTKAKWIFESKKNPTNLCRGKALRLTANKKQTVFINYGYEAPLWYKVVLPKKKTLTLYLTRMDSDSIWDWSFTVFNIKGEVINCPSLTETSYRTAVLPKGTYFIRLQSRAYEHPFDYLCRVATIKWR